jgi:dihydrofolate reductase
MSLDGFTAGPNVSETEPMGEGGEGLHEWMGGDREVDVSVRQEVNAMVGATIIGRRTFDLGLRPWGGTPWPGVPSFVVTHRTREDLVGDNGGTFAFDELESAVRRAKEAAGDKGRLGARGQRGPETSATLIARADIPRRSTRAACGL